MGVSYSDSGVNQAEEERVLAGLIPLLESTFLREGLGQPLLPIGFFCNVIEVGDLGIALTADGVGTKVVFAGLAGTKSALHNIGECCVHGVLNDLLCVGARPIAFLDSISVASADSAVLVPLIEGMVRAAKAANVSIVGGEIAQEGALLANIPEAPPFTIHGVGVGLVPRHKGPETALRIIDGQSIKPGDLIIGLRSSGPHCNGFSLIRSLDERGKLKIDEPLCGETVLDALLHPTRSYIKPIFALLKRGVKVKGLAHLSGGGWRNLLRLKTKHSFALDNYIKFDPIFQLIADCGISTQEMFGTFNMGYGFAVIIPPDPYQVTIALDAITHFFGAEVLGKVVKAKQRFVGIKPYKIRTDEGAPGWVDWEF